MAIEPEYAHSKKRQLCVGGLAGELVLCWKEAWGLFTSNKRKVVCTHALEIGSEKCEEVSLIQLPFPCFTFLVNGGDLSDRHNHRLLYVHVSCTHQLHAGEGPIYTIRWRSLFIAWANDHGVKIYDTSTQQRITFIDRPPNRCVMCVHVLCEHVCTYAIQL